VKDTNGQKGGWISGRSEGGCIRAQDQVREEGKEGTSKKRKHAGEKKRNDDDDERSKYQCVEHVGPH